MPYRASRQASVNPVGPAPATMTGQCSACDHRRQVSRKSREIRKLIARLSTASAASLTASGSVGWAWQVRAMSSAEAPNSMAIAASRDHVAGVGADDVHAEHAVGLGVGEDFDEAVGRADWPWRGRWR